MNDIKRWIQRRTNELADGITAEKLFNSPEFAQYVNGSVGTVLGPEYRKVRVVLENAGNCGRIGCTNGDLIWLNTCNDIADYYNLLDSKFAAFMGVVFHECAHIKFHDFVTERAEMEKLNDGKFPGAEPEAEDEDDEDLIDEVKTALADPSYAPIFKSVYHELSNIISDVHDEGKMMDKFEGFVSECILFSAQSLRASCISLEEMEKKEKKKELSPLSIAYNVILQFLRFGSVLSLDEKSAYTSKYFTSLYKYSRHAFLARWEDNQKETLTHINHILLALWPFIKEQLEEEREKNDPSSGSGSGQQQQGSGGSSQQGGIPQQLSQSEIQSILNQLQQGAQNAGTTAKPENRKTSKEAKAQKGSGENNAKAHGAQEKKPAVEKKQNAANTKPSENVSGTTSMVAKSIAQSIAETEAEKQISSEINQEVNVPSENTHHIGIPVDVRRNLSVNASDVAEYEDQMKDLKLYSKTIQRQILELFREISEGELAKHKLFGNRFNASDAYRIDQRMFANKKQPQDTPNMAIAILVDCSYSMNGERLCSAKKAAMLLHDFADGLNIPVFVAGHNTSGQKVVYTVVAAFDKATKKDKYRISKLTPSGSNRDGLAIEKTINLLAKRPEEMKVFFIISDGQPAHDGYGGEEARKDIQAIVAKGRRAGVETFAAAIGSDKDKIEAIYKEGFLDIDDLSKLPKTLTKLVRKRLFR